MQVAQNVPIIVLVKYIKVFKNYCLFSAWCDKRRSTKNRRLGIFDIHSKISKLINNFRSFLKFFILKMAVLKLQKLITLE